MTHPPAENELTLTLERTLSAPRSVVWRCWTDTALLKQWYCPKPWTVPEADFDLRVGGRMNTVMAGPNGERFEGKGMWLAIEPMERLVFTDAYTEGFMPAAEPFMTGVVQLADAPNGHTRMTWSARHANTDTKAKHLAMGWEAGWNAAADQLDALVQTLAPEAATTAPHTPKLPYVDGFLLTVPTANRETYRRYAEEVAVVFKEHGALSLVECWGDDVPEGKLNSMHTAVLRQPDETVVFSWITWPDKATRDAGMQKVFADPRQPTTMAAMPFDGTRMIFGGFEMIVNA
jgi:uncharacterized protein YbaA (DUF1428 family)/uncharacterized protein YndB with AHSA1/START domain